MIMPLVASLLAPAMLAASTFSNVVGTLNGDVFDESTSGYASASAVIAVPSEDLEWIELMPVETTLHLRLGDLSFDYHTDDADCLFFTANSTVQVTPVSFATLGTDGFNDVYPLVAVDAEYNSNLEVTINLPLSSLYSPETNLYGFYVVFQTEGLGYVPYFPANSYAYHENGVGFYVDVLTSTVDANDVISAVTGGLNVVPHLGGSLSDGFDAVFMNNGTLTVVGLFAFALMGLGIGVGVVKKVFNWITGRHGM